MPKPQAAPRLLTSGEIARRLDEPVHRVLRVLATRPDIQPTAFSAHVRLYDRKAMARVRYELSAIDARRCKTERGVGHE